MPERAKAQKVKLCILFCITEQEEQVSVDGFCVRYSKVIQNERDAASFKAIPRSSARDRLSANEVNYRCKCEGWKDPICNRAQ